MEYVRQNLPKKIYIILIMGFLLASSLATARAQDTGAVDMGARLFSAVETQNVIVGETFRVSVFLDTEDNIINTIDVRVKFPSDKLQVVSPSVGKSIIGIWTAAPSFNNSTGDIHFQGGIPSPGIRTSKGLISDITFRAKSVGSATISFSGDSKILLNDGFGTNVLTTTQGTTINLSLPLPAGPAVTSPTHPDQGEWYKAKTATLQWVTDYPQIEGFSYVLNDTPVDEPDDISEGIKQEISYKNLRDGFHYFHIKALRNGTWGGTTHFALKIDSTAPAEFTINILPKVRTTSRFPIFDFNTTDSGSGISHYELRIIPLDTKDAQTAAERYEEGFFIEVPTRYISDVALGLGEYDTIVRAYDNAGNFREIARRFNIVTPLLTSGKDGLTIINKFVVSWISVIISGFLLLALLIYLALLSMRRHHDTTLRRVEGALEDPVIRRRLEELQKRRRNHENLKHKVATFILIATTALFALPAGSANAQQVAALPPPIITTISENISNDQLFYVGGQTDIADSEVIIFLQNLQDGQVTSESIMTDQKGDWFYARPEPLLKGSYILWSQSKIGSELSPPSPQKRINVSQTALQLGASRLSFETLYFFIALILFGAVLVLGSFTSYHLFHGRRKRRELAHEIEEADAVIKEGFATLHEDINAELDIIHKARLSKILSIQQENQEKHLLKDLDEVEKFIKKEFKDVKLKSRTV